MSYAVDPVERGEEAHVRSKRRRPENTGYGTDHRRSQSAPADLMHSRDVGLVRVLCAHCGANTDARPIHHDKQCDALRGGDFERQRQRALPKGKAGYQAWKLA